MNVAEPVAPCVLIQYMMGRKLQFAPDMPIPILVIQFWAKSLRE